MRPDRVRGNIFVSNLPAGFTDAQLAEMFDAYGLVLSAYMARDPQTGVLRNHGLVDLAPSKAVPEAVAELDGRSIDGQVIGVRAADPNRSLPPPPIAASKPRLAKPQPETIAHQPRQRVLVVERRPIGYRSRAG